MIGAPDQGMMPELRNIWMACFGDSAAYVDFLCEGLLRPEHMLAYWDGDGIPLAMLCFRPCVVREGVAERKAAYVYGVATHPGARGQGLSTKLMKELDKALIRRGCSLSLLVPAGKSLFRFYGDRGYETAISIRVARVNSLLLPENSPCVLSPASLPTLWELRNNAHRGRSLYVEWDRDYLGVIHGECRLQGGEVLAVSGVGRRGYAVCVPREDRVEIRELVCAPERMEDVLCALHRRYGAAEYRLRLPEEASSPWPEELLPFAMAKWYDKRQQRARGDKPGYIAHVLD